MVAELKLVDVANVEARSQMDEDLMPWVVCKVINRVLTFVPWSRISFVNIEIPVNHVGMDKLNYYRVLTNTDKGSPARRKVVYHLGEEMRHGFKGFLVNEYPEESKKIKWDGDMVTTSFVFDMSNGRQALLLLPSVDSLDTDAFLKQQGRARRVVSHLT